MTRLRRKRISLTQYLVEQQREHGHIPAQLRLLIEVVARACKRIAIAVNKGALGDVLGSAGSENVQGEVQKKLDVIANEVLIEANEWGGHLAAMASEEMDSHPRRAQPLPAGRVPAAVRPARRLAATSTSTSRIGTIFSVLRKVGHARGVSEEDFLQPGKQQAAAGYCVYGPQTTLVLTVGDGVAMFTLDRETGSWVLTARGRADPRGHAGSSPSTCPTCATGRRRCARYIDECLAGKDGPRGKDFNMRWVASMVADVHRILTRGGVFLYPWDQREPDKPGKLRLMYEANPMAFLVEQAGGVATNGRERILDIVPTKLHERVSVVLGSKNEVERVTDYHAEPG